MDRVPPGVTTMEIAARHLRVGQRRLHQLAVLTRLTAVAPVHLGRALGSYRLIPHLSVPVLRQALSPEPRRLAAWQEALQDILASKAWAQALNAIAHQPTGPTRPAQTTVDDLLLSPALLARMDDLYREGEAALTRHGLTDLIEVQSFVVDRLEDAEEAVILVGPTQRSYLLPRWLLRVAGLEREKVWGILMATRTGTGIDLDVWPALGDDTWAPDAELFALRTDVGA
jgi:hypothetical protein